MKIRNCVVSGFRREADENCIRLGCYAASSGNSLRTFHDRCSEMSVKNYDCTLCNNPEERVSRIKNS